LDNLVQKVRSRVNITTHFWIIASCTQSEVQTHLHGIQCPWIATCKWTKKSHIWVGHSDNNNMDELWVNICRFIDCLPKAVSKVTRPIVKLINLCMSCSHPTLIFILLLKRWYKSVCFVTQDLKPWDCSCLYVLVCCVGGQICLLWVVIIKNGF